MACEAEETYDSDDDYDSDDYPGPRISHEDWERYEKQVEESDGFDVDYITEIGDNPEIISPVDRKRHKLYVPYLMNALKEHNRSKKDLGGRLTEFKKIIKITAICYPFPRFYFTFEARDVPGRRTPGRIRTGTYQTQVELVPGHLDLTFKVFRKKASSVV